MTSGAGGRGRSRTPGTSANRSKDEILSEIETELEAKLAMVRQNQAANLPVVVNAVTHATQLVNTAKQNPDDVITQAMGALGAEYVRKINASMNTSRKDFLLTVVEKQLFAGDLANITAVEQCFKHLKEQDKGMLHLAVKYAFSQQYMSECGIDDLEGFRKGVAKGLEELGEQRGYATGAQAMVKAMAKAKASASSQVPPDATMPPAPTDGT